MDRASYKLRHNKSRECLFSSLGITATCGYGFITAACEMGLKWNHSIKFPSAFGFRITQFSVHQKNGVSNEEEYNIQMLPRQGSVCSFNITTCALFCRLFLPSVNSSVHGDGPRLFLSPGVFLSTDFTCSLFIR